VFKRDYKEKVAIASVLAALSAVPISLGLTTSNGVMHFFWLAIGLILWMGAIVLLFPHHSKK
jgi:hypothetical protein